MPREAPFYLAGATLGFAAVCLWVLGGGGWSAALLLAAAAAALGQGGWLAWRRVGRVRIGISDAQLHPIPVLDAPKGTWSLIAGMQVEVRNRHAHPLGVRMSALLYRRGRWGWDRKVGDAPPVALLPPSVVAGRGSKTFLAKSTLRLPDDIPALDRAHFVKLLIETTGVGTTVRRVFLARRFELRPAATTTAARNADDGAPLLPYLERADGPGNGRFDSEGATRGRRRGVSGARPLWERLGRLAAGLGFRRTGRRRRAAAPVVRIEELRHSDDSLEGLAEELQLELEELDLEPFDRRADRGGESGPG